VKESDDETAETVFNRLLKKGPEVKCGESLIDQRSREIGLGRNIIATQGLTPIAYFDAVSDG
jgi:hypothetical protein